MIDVRDAELISAIEREAQAANIKAGACVLIGAVDSFVVSTMPTNDPTDDLVSEYRIPAELHGTGELIDGNAHIHATLAVQGDRAIAGHLHRAEVKTHFVRAYLFVPQS